MAIKTLKTSGGDYTSLDTWFSDLQTKLADGTGLVDDWTLYVQGGQTFGSLSTDYSFGPGIVGARKWNGFRVTIKTDPASPTTLATIQIKHFTLLSQSVDTGNIVIEKIKVLAALNSSSPHSFFEYGPGGSPNVSVIIRNCLIYIASSSTFTNPFIYALNGGSYTFNVVNCSIFYSWSGASGSWSLGTPTTKLVNLTNCLVAFFTNSTMTVDTYANDSISYCNFWNYGSTNITKGSVLGTLLNNRFKGYDANTDPILASLVIQSNSDSQATMAGRDASISSSSTGVFHNGTNTNALGVTDDIIGLARTLGSYSRGAYEAILSVPPTITLGSISQRASDNKVVINYTGANSGNICSLTTNGVSGAYKYALPPYTSWNLMTPATGDVQHSGVTGLPFASSGTPLAFVWNAESDISYEYLGFVEVSLTAYDGTLSLASSGSTSSPFTLVTQDAFFVLSAGDSIRSSATAVDFTYAEQNQFRDALGIDGLKTTSSGGVLQSISGNLDTLRFADGTVYFDNTNGTALSAYPYGTSTKPTKNMTDVEAICTLNNLKRIVVRSNYTTLANLQYKVLMTDGYNASVNYYPVNLVVGSGFQLNANTINKMYLTITDTTSQLWSNNVYDSWVNIASLTSAGGNNNFYNCVIKNFYANNGVNRFFNCSFDGSATQYLDCTNVPNGASRILFTGCKGTIIIKNYTNASGLILYFDDFEGNITIDATCTHAERITIIGGAVALTNNGTGTPTIVRDYKLIDSTNRIMLSAVQPDYAPATSTQIVALSAYDKTRFDTIDASNSVLISGVNLNTQGKADVRTEVDNALTGYNTTGVAKEASVQSIQNNTSFVASITPYYLIPYTNYTMYKIDVSVYDNQGNMEDPDSNELALKLETANATSKNDILYKEFAKLNALEASSTFSGFVKLERENTGSYYCFVAIESTESPTQLDYVFNFNENTLFKKYSRTNLMLTTAPGTTILEDSATNRDIIAKAIKSQNVASTSGIGGSVYSDLLVEMSLIDSNVTSVFNKTVLIDNKTTNLPSDPTSETIATANRNLIMLQIVTISADVWSSPVRTLTQAVIVSGNVSLDPSTRVVLSSAQPDYDIPTEVNIILTSAHGGGQWDAINTLPVVLSASQPYFTPASAGDNMGLTSATLTDLLKHSDLYDGQSIDYILQAAMAMVNGDFTISGNTMTLYKRDGLTPFSVITRTTTNRTRIS